MSTRAVIFDLFGTLVPAQSTDGRKAMLKSIAERLGAPVEEFQRAFEARSQARMTGQDRTYAESIVRACAETGITPQLEFVDQIRMDVLTQFREYLNPREESIPCLNNLKELGYRLGLISDCNGEIPDLWPQTQFAALIPVATFSSVLGIQKPHPSMYTETCAVLQVAPEQCVYVGDGGSRELSGATSVGMHAVQLLDSIGDSQSRHRPGLETWAGPAIDSLDRLPGYIEKI